MSDQTGDHRSANLDRVSEELLRSLRRCRVMMNDYRAKLSAANSNEPAFMLRDAEQQKEQGEETA